MRYDSALCLSVALFFAPSVFADRVTYCCSEENGRQACSDILPPQCYGRAYRELNDRGITIRRHDAPLTAEQRDQRIAEQHRKQEEERLVQEQRRKDLALLNTYNSVQDIDLFRERAIQDLDKQIVDIRVRQDEFVEKRKQLLQEAEFYKNKPMPFELSNAIKDSEAEIEIYESVVDSKKKDIETVKAKFDEDKRRYLELTRGAKRKTGGAATGSAGESAIR